VDPRRISKSLSYWLRHKPDAAGLTLDHAGWAPVDQVLAALARAGLTDRRDELEQVVATNDKARFEFSDDARLIRARQGHSLTVDLDWPLADPPEPLFHGTVDRFLDAILRDGLKPMARHHVHLSPDIATAQAVGARRGKAIVLRVAAGEMARAGHQFRLSANGVWLTATVPPPFLERLATG
jgi:putative RNA 2'-phosphotransferase